MNDRILHNLGFARKLLLTVAAALAIAVPLMFGLFSATPSRAQELAANANSSTPTYSSVSIKPSAIPNGDKRTKMMFSLMDGSFVARGTTLQRLIQTAFHVQDSQISGGPDWLNTMLFDIDATLDPTQFAAVQQQFSEHKDQGLLQRLLADQFKLATHSEARNVATYDLVAGENGAKLQASGNQPRVMRFGNGELSSSGAPLELLTAQLSVRLGRPVVDKTGLKGLYAFNLRWTPDPTEEQHLHQSGQPFFPEPAPNPNGPSLMTAVQQQLGLKLVPNTEPVQVLVIDHAEQPSEN